MDKGLIFLKSIDFILKSNVVNQEPLKRYIISKRVSQYHCVGALDRKRIIIQPSANSGSHYYNHNNSQQLP